MARVFVYGTLLRAERGHGLLAGARFLGHARTERGWALLDLGEYPALVPGEGAVAGELYEVGFDLLRRLDAYEGAPRLFRRERIGLACGGEAEAYVLASDPAPGARPIGRGDWPARVRGPPTSPALPGRREAMRAALPLLALVPLAAASNMDRVTGKPFATRSPVLARHAMAATSQPLATQVALEILRAGGSAVDAAIAANAVLALVEPTGCGLGGDLFAMVWDAEEGVLHGLNASGRSPRGLSLEELRELCPDGRIPSHGPLSVSVPGCVDGWFELHGRFGKLPMEDVLAPAIRYAREGAPITQVIAYYWRFSARSLSRWPGFEEQMTIDGRAPREGELWRNPNLAATLEALAEEGRDAFYRGRIARTIADFVQEHGGFLAYEDLAEHRSEWVEPVSTTYRGHTLHELPPNGQGIAALQMLNVLEEYDLASIGFGSPDHLHLLVEAKKLAFEDRARFYADPEFADVPVARLVSKEYAAARRERIDLEAASKSIEPENPALAEGDTIYLAVADDDGNMVSLIQSNFRGMGSGMTPPGLGFVLQDRGELFDLEPGRPNSYAPGKRPFHTIIPAFATRDGEPWLCYGVMGGATQPQGHVQILVNMVDFGMNVQEAGDAPRIVHTGSSQPTGERMTDGGEVHLENGFGKGARDELRRRGHRIGGERGLFGGFQGILVGKDRVYHGASESRKDGHAAGY